MKLQRPFALLFLAALLAIPSNTVWLYLFVLGHASLGKNLASGRDTV